ncbi:hypothetical protein VOLCADRAFT_93791 [Volvox carteri f. nagariensis]|uniref:BACK domain-containing protein n=1 Tax=Volvox carteri f. nagariensis TaxID=3068 RepID=D8U325_VOLCA|nr:uncharacterized protein VOLCADRAFT_93791 [Volvox carteri f. nagariensis]EFJ45905.1 hypothetical protein VOLCADRAFT_93791 [Volvox carteri f. nagariensis]|eukprot:XP_002952983.1 hypothetical protein VOLCADRAFT_93791 [Volvox carteri f. nagariensis]
MKTSGNEHVAKQLASLYSSEDDSDCVVVFCLNPSSLQDTSAPATGEPFPKRQRVGDGSVSIHGRGDSIIVGDPLPGHQLVLRFASERFGAQLKRWDTRKSRNGTSEQSGLPPATVDGRPVLRVNLNNEGEEPSARAAIRYAYTGDVRASSIREALEVRRQALNLRVEGCAAACMEIVKAKFAEASATNATSTSGPGNNVSWNNLAGERSAGFASSPRSGSSGGGANTSTGMTNSADGLCAPILSGPLPPPEAVLDLYSCEPIWPDPAQEPDFAAILAAAKPQLVRHFGDALRTLNTRSLRQQLLKLHGTAVEALLESDDFGTDNESSVLLLLATWMSGNHASTDALMRERLCRQVRLVQLSRPYLSSILPVLALDYETCGASEPLQPVAATGAAAASVGAAGAYAPTSNSGGIGAAATSASAVPGSTVTTVNANTCTNPISGAAATANSPRSPTCIAAAASPAAWFPIRGAEAAFICSLVTAQPPLRDALLSAGRKVYDMDSPWYSQRRRRQCLPPTGLVYHWHITEQELHRALAELQPGALCCMAGSFRGDFTGTVVASGFEWWPSIEYRHGATDANLGLYSQFPEAYQVRGSSFTGAKSAIAVVAGVDADLSVHHWHQEALVDDGVYFSTTKDIWPVGGGRGANVLALRQLPEAPSMAPTAEVRSTGVSSCKGCRGLSNSSATTAVVGGLLSAWSDYLRDGEVAGTVTLLQPPPCADGVW